MLHRRSRTMLRYLVSCAFAASSLSACLDKGGGETGGETHWQSGWLAGCVSDADCGDGLACIGNLCTVRCEGDEACAEFEGGSCVELDDGSACVVSERLTCSTGAIECTDQTEGWFCGVEQGDGCALPIEICHDGAWSEATLDVCRDTVSDPQPTGNVSETTIGDAPVALDILFVIDTSSSMADEQRGLSRALAGFAGALDSRIEARPRIAATSVDVQCEINQTTVFSAKGVFNTHAARFVPPTGQFQLAAACASDADCATAACDALGACDGQDGLWACRTQIEACIENPNGSVNTRCRRRCESDDECRQLLNDEGASCQKPSSNPADWGCIINPPTEQCPDELPDFVEGDQLELAPCLTALGINQDKCLLFEQGLEASRLALDPTGPNGAQANAFLRPEAILVVIYLSDEDDCSASQTIGEDDFETCTLLKDSDEGGPLVPTSRYVDFLRGAKPAGRVMAMAVVGQSLATDPVAAESDYQAYLASKGDARACHHQTTLCQSSLGGADWGRRYAEVAAGFGPDGHVESICSLDGEFVAPLTRVAERIAANAKRVCLPTASAEGIAVELVRGGAIRSLERDLADDDGYEVIDGAAECASGMAIAPHARMVAGDLVRITAP